MAEHANAIARAIFQTHTLFEHGQNIPARRRTGAIKATWSFSKLLHFRSAGFRAYHVALVVVLVCGQSHDFRVCRRVTRGVPDRARVSVCSR